jgi:CRISPR-associated protein Cst2
MMQTRLCQFFTLSAKLILNAHDLNNEGTAGNVSDIRTIEYVGLDGQRREAPAVSGRMLKHYHYAAMREIALGTELSLCDGCRAGEPIRPARRDGERLTQLAMSEAAAVAGCAICDVHGYLIAQAPRGERGRGVSTRRNSRCTVSWLLPVLDGAETSSRQVVHTRVSQQEASEQQQTQMLFYKSYASGLYGFISALDIGRIGYLEAEGQRVENLDWQTRARAAILAYRDLLSGRLGASQSHALPHAAPLEVTVALSFNGPLPNPVSPIYPDYRRHYLGLLPAEGVEVLGYGGAPLPGLTLLPSIREVLDHALQQIAGVRL